MRQVNIRKIKFRSNSESLGQFRPILLLNIGGKIVFGIIGKRVTDYASKNVHINESVPKWELQKIPWYVEHAYSVGVQYQRRI